MVVKDKAIVFFGIGFELIGMMVGGFFLGVEIDKYMGWNGYAVIGLVLTLLLAWFIHLIYLLQRFEKSEQADGNSNPPQP
jgi:F0F1-type ATP synthase assembly protein I